MVINVYSGYGVRVETVLLWKAFFERQFPGTETHFVDGRRLLSNSPAAIVFPGGSASKFAKSIGGKRREKLKEWVQGGGNYIGICAGAYLASETYTWSLGISPVKISRPWQRGHHKARIQMVDGYRKVDYFNGPVFEKWARNVKVVARYIDDIPNPVGEHDMPLSPAILTNAYGAGKCCCSVRT